MADVIARGIDISSHQGDIDFTKVKAAGYSYVIIKAGQGLREMHTFKGRYLPAVLAAGLDWGAYWWSDAVTVDEAGTEARAFVKVLDGLRPTYPVYMDQEYESPCGNAWGVGRGKQLRTDMAKAFLGVLQDAGYYAGLYASKDWLDYWVDAGQLTAYDKWVAQYAPCCTYQGVYGMWQRTGGGTCPGISVPVDINECYRDYPGIMRAHRLNGWTPPSTQDKPAEAPEEETVRIPTEELKAAYSALQAAHDATGEAIEKLKKMLGV